jgi:hypothetical protein
MIGSASHPAPELYGRVDGTFQDRASRVVVWVEFQSRDYLNVLEELISLLDRKAKYEPGDSRQ